MFCTFQMSQAFLKKQDSHVPDHWSNLRAAQRSLPKSWSLSWHIIDIPAHAEFIWNAHFSMACVPSPGDFHRHISSFWPKLGHFYAQSGLHKLHVAVNPCRSLPNALQLSSLLSRLDGDHLAFLRALSISTLEQNPASDQIKVPSWKRSYSQKHLFKAFSMIWLNALSPGGNKVLAFSIFFPFCRCNASARAFLFHTACASEKAKLWTRMTNLSESRAVWLDVSRVESSSSNSLKAQCWGKTMVSRQCKDGLSWTMHSL